MSNLRVVTFCRNHKCCPVVTELPDGKISLGDKEGVEGETIWTKEQFKDFLTSAKKGEFDNLVEKETD